MEQEEKEKELKTRREEQQIKKQMAVIRKEMQEARKQEAEDRWRSVGLFTTHMSFSVCLLALICFGLGFF